MNYDSRDIKTPRQMLEWAIHEASEVHFGETDKAGKSYILHSIRVMLHFTDIDEQIVAIMHDVVEKSGQSIYLTISDFILRKHVDAILALTRNQGETYQNYIKRVAQNPLAKKVKIADLLDNLNRDRIPNPTKKDLDRWEKYEKALAFLREEEEVLLSIQLCPRCNQPPKVRRTPLGGISISCSNSNGHKIIETELRGDDRLAVADWNRLVEVVKRMGK